MPAYWRVAASTSSLDMVVVSTTLHLDMNREYVPSFWDSPCSDPEGYKAAFRAFAVLKKPFLDGRLLLPLALVDVVRDVEAVLGALDDGTVSSSFLHERLLR